MFSPYQASINDLHAEIESLKKIVQLLLEKIEILEIREPSSDSTAFEIMLSTGKWVSINISVILRPCGVCLSLIVYSTTKRIDIF
jgi:hypothetical protein